MLNFGGVPNSSHGKTVMGPVHWDPGHLQGWDSTPEGLGEGKVFFSGRQRRKQKKHKQKQHEAT